MKYEDYEKMVFLLAHKYCPVKNQDDPLFQEYVSVGQEAFVKATKKYDPSKGIAFSTFLYRVVSNNMMDYYEKEKKHYGHVPYELIMDLRNKYDYFADMEPVDSRYAPHSRVEFRDSIESLGDEAKAVARIIFESPGELLQSTKSMAPKYLTGALNRLLRKKGFKWSEMEIGKNEIKAALQEM